jgi:hypothetical protein
MAATPPMYGIQELYHPVDDSVEVEWVFDNLSVLNPVNSSTA